MTSKASCQLKLYQLFHGDSSNASSAATIQLLFEGRQQFSDLFDREQVVVVSAVHTDASTENLTLSRRFTQNDTQNYSIGVIPNTHITISLLSRKAANSLLKVTATTLWRQAHAALRNGKKALAIAEAYLNSDGSLPSGTTADDFYEHILAEMYLARDGFTNVLSPDDEDDEAKEEDEVVRPQQEHREEGWFFDGWFSFVLWGPLAKEEDKSNLLKAGEFKIGRIDSGRNAARVAATAERNTERS